MSRNKEEPMYPLSVVAQRLGVRPGTVRQWVKRGQIEGTKLGRDWFFTDKQISQRVITKPAKR